MSDEDRIARVARALCVADGQDPEAEITVGTDVVEEGGGERYHEVTAPAWTSYAGEARRMIAAVRAMGLLE
jgi:ribonuclease PH